MLTRTPRPGLAAPGPCTLGGSESRCNRSRTAVVRWVVVLVVAGAIGLGIVVATRSSPTRSSSRRAPVVHRPGDHHAAPAARGGRRTSCFATPEPCGYPGVGDAGVENCSALPNSSGTKTITTSETIENTDITGYVVVDASGVTLNHDCVVFNGGEAAGSAAVVLESAASDFTISNTTVRADNTTSDSFEEAIRNNHSDAGAVASRDRLEDCAECIHQLWTLSESYVLANGRAAAAGVHTEDWWFDNNTIAANDDTLLNPAQQTAVIFAESSGACEDHETVTNSLLAGGGYLLYFCTHSTSAGSSTIEIRNNRVARCATAEEYVSDTGGYQCRGGSDAHGYWPRGGYFGVVGTHYTGSGQVWEQNVWDNDLQTIAGP